MQLKVELGTCIDGDENQLARASRRGDIQR